MKSVACIRVLLTLVSSAMIVTLLIQPVSSSHRALHHNGNHESVRASSHHRRNHSHEEAVHNNHHTHNRHQTHRPAAAHLEALDHQPLGYWPICSSCHSVHFDLHRVPKVLPIASCCSVDPRLNITTGVRGLRNVHCETIYYNLLVKQRRIENQTEESEDSWEDKWLKVPAGCTPAHPVTQRHSSNEEYVRPGPTLS